MQLKPKLNRVRHLTSDPLCGRLTLPTNIRLDWKGLSGTITLAYQKIVNYGRKKFYSIGPIGETVMT
jgi:hypothetical protein